MIITCTFAEALQFLEFSHSGRLSALSSMRVISTSVVFSVVLFSVLSSQASSRTGSLKASVSSPLSSTSTPSSTYYYFWRTSPNGRVTDAGYYVGRTQCVTNTDNSTCQASCGDTFQTCSHSNADENGNDDTMCYSPQDGESCCQPRGKHWSGGQYLENCFIYESGTQTHRYYSDLSEWILLRRGCQQFRFWNILL